jgi:hypothetical protein
MIEAAHAWLGTGVARGGGSGFAAYPELSVLRSRLDSVHAEIHPRAREIAELAAADGLQLALPPELALPVYVRDNVAVVPVPPAARA